MKRGQVYGVVVRKRGNGQAAGFRGDGVIRRLAQPARTGLFDRTDLFRYPVGGLGHGLSVGDVPQGIGGAAFDLAIRINLKRRGKI